MLEDAEAMGLQTLQVEAPESRSLPALLAPELRQGLIRLSRNRQAKAVAERALRALAGFVKAFKVKYADLEVTLDRDPEPGLAPVRSKLIGKGMVWSPSHGDTAFTVPLFDQLMRRIMPGGDWRT